LELGIFFSFFGWRIFTAVCWDHDDQLNCESETDYSCSWHDESLGVGVFFLVRIRKVKGKKKYGY